MKFKLSIFTMFIASSAFGAGSCIICPFGYSCAGGTEAPVKVGEMHICPAGEFWNANKILRYQNGSIKYENDGETPQTEPACDVCPAGAFCPVPGASPLAAPTPVGSIIYMAHLNQKNYSDDFYSSMGSDEKTALGLLDSALTGTECPDGYLYADGSVKNIKDYPALFEILGQAYGYDSTRTTATFKLPDLRGMFIRGVGGNAADVGEFQDSENKAHTHSYTMPSGSDSHSGSPHATVTGTTTGTTTSSGGDESRPMNYAMYVCVKY